MDKNRIEFSAPLFLAFVLLFTLEPAYAGEKVILPESISIKVVMMSYIGNQGDVSVDLNLAPSGYMFHSTSCSRGDKKIENREVEKLLEFISTLRDGGGKATCCDHPWTEINLNYSSPPSHKKITVGSDLLELKEIFNLCESPSVRFNPDDVKSQRRLGEQFYEIRLYDRAAEALERAVKLDPEHVAVELREVLGDTYRRLGNDEKALEAYKRALGLRPESAELFLKLGSLYSESGRLPESIEAYKQALHFAPTGDAANNAQAGIGYIYENQGRFADAAKAFKEVLRAKPDDASTRFSLGKIYLELGDISSALAQHKKLKDLESIYADDLYLKIYQHAVRQNPDDPDAHFNLGNAYYWAKRYSEAIDPYKQAVRLKPDLELAYARLGTSYAKLDQYEPAIEAFEAAIRLKPQEPINRVSAGLMYFYVGKNVQAIAHLNEAIRLKPDLAAAHNNLGYVLRSTGADREAIVSLKEAIRLDPDDELAPYNMGVAYQNLGEYEEAVEAYKKAIVLKPEFIDARFQLGSAYYWMGNQEAALKEYDDLKVWDKKRAEELHSMISRVALPPYSLLEGLWIADNFAESIFYLIIGIVAVSIFFAKSVKFVRPEQRMIVERFGAYSRMCGPGWCLIVPFVERSIVLQLNEFAPGWKAYGEEQLRQKLVHDFYQKANRNVPAPVATKASGDVPARVATKASDSDWQSDLDYCDPVGRLVIFAFFFGVGVVAFLVELKTGYHVGLPQSGRGFLITQVHGPWSLDEVWTHLPDELSGLIFPVLCVLAFVVVELLCRFESRKKTNTEEY